MVDVFTQNMGLWGWISVGLILLGLELVMGTQWLLWLGTAALLTAASALLPFNVGIIGQGFIFSALSALMIGASMMMKPKEDMISDLNEPEKRLIGQKATVLSGFEVNNGTLNPVGRVSFDDVVWPAYLLEGEIGALSVDSLVDIVGHKEGKLIIRPIKAH